MKDLTERAKYYREKAKQNKSEKNSMSRTMIYLRQRHPDVWALMGLMYFMISLLIGLGLMLFYGIRHQGEGLSSIQFLTPYRTWLYTSLFCSWCVCSPIHVFMMKHELKDIAAKYPKTSIVNYQLENFKLFQKANMLTIKSKIYCRVANELEQRAKMHNIMNKENVANKDKLTQHTKKCEELIENVDKRLTKFVKSDYTFFTYYEKYLSLDWQQKSMESMMFAVMFMMFWAFPYFFPRETPDNIAFEALLNIGIPAIIGLAFPFILAKINFFWDKKSFAILLQENETEIIKADSKHWKIEDDIDSKLEELKDEYVRLLVEMEDY